ncbi:MAG: hypothetical protein HeimC2_05270 [Candidatus Heimdallarchaeota archaeon LC_2]|nr:MAG: hypothetical protein HeimC2_05270 [Candidatus Heimdallarchaeota archaeon LC_2]
MSSGKFRLLTIICLLILVFQTSSQQITANQLNLPRLNSFQTTIFGDAGNDILIGSNDRLSILDHDFRVNSGSADLLYTNENNRLPLGNFDSSSSPFQLFNHGLNHFINDTNENLRIDFETHFYDLLLLNEQDLNNTNLVEDVLLFDDEYYGLQFEVSEQDVMKPLSIATGIQNSRDNFDFDFHLQTPSGTIQTLRSLLPRFVDTLIPFVPYENGTYTLFVQPRDGDVVLNHFAILNNFPVEEVDNGCIKTYRGTRTDVNFYKPRVMYPLPVTTDAFVGTDINGQQGSDILTTDLLYDPIIGDPVGNIEINGYTYQDPIIQDIDNHGEMFGSSDIRVHTPFAPFGGSVFSGPQTSLHRGDTIISTILTPPDESNPSVRKQKSDIGIPKGYEIEIGFWWEFTPLEELDTGSNINLFNQNRDFFLNLDADMILGMNDSVTDEFTGGINSDAIFTDIHTGETHFFDARNNDILNFNNKRLDMLPAGNYSVEVSGSNNAWVQINLFEYKLFNGNEETITQDVGDISIFEIPANGFLFDAFNFTYIRTGGSNMSSSFTTSIYDSSGGRINTDQFTWDHYANFVNFTHVEGITDEFAGGVSRGGTFLLIHNTGNDLWNSSKLVPDILESDIDVPSTLQIKHIDNIERLEENNPNNEYFTGSLTTEQNLNVSKSEIRGYFDYTSSIGGNRLILSSMNITMDVTLIQEGTNIWEVTGSSLRTIDGVDYYSVILEFATMFPTDFVIEVIFTPSANGNTFNGTYSAVIEHTDIFNLPEITLRTLSLTRIDSDGEIPENIVTQGGDTGFNFGTTLGVTAGIVTIGVIFYAVQGRGFRFRKE